MTSAYPPVDFTFSVRIADNPPDAGSVFQEVSGLTNEREVTGITEGGENRFVHHVPGRVKHQNLVLKRGMVPSTSPLLDWCKTTLEAGLSTRIQTKDLTVSLLDQKQQPVMNWSVNSAWPIKWQVASFTTEENTVLIETLELSFQRIERRLDRQFGAPGLFE